MKRERLQFSEEGGRERRRKEKKRKEKKIKKKRLNKLSSILYHMLVQ